MSGYVSPIMADTGKYVHVGAQVGEYRIHPTGPIMKMRHYVFSAEDLTLFVQQRTNLDVNLAVNNLLSRDDEEGEEPEGGEGGDGYVPEDLISLLDGGGFHAAQQEHSVIIDADTMFSEDIFGYAAIRRYNCRAVLRPLSLWVSAKKRRSGVAILKLITNLAVFLTKTCCSIFFMCQVE